MNQNKPQWINSNLLVEEGTQAMMIQKFVFRNGMWMPHSKPFCKVEGVEKEINARRKATAEKKKAKVEKTVQQVQEKIKEKNSINLSSFEL